MERKLHTNERPEEPIEEEGDDPRDTPKPKIYGEEIDPHNCEPEFIVTPRPKCETQKIPVPAFRGDFCYFIFPGSPWEKVSPVGKLIEAQAFFEKYCMYFNFVEKTLSPKNSEPALTKKACFESSPSKAEPRQSTGSWR